MVKKILRNLDVAVSAVFLSVTVLVVITNVILRYVFQSGLFWVEEVATVSFIWSVFVGAAAAYRLKAHIGIDLVTRLFSERVREIVSIVISLMLAIINGYICYLSILFIGANQLKRTPVLDVPSVYVNLAITAGFGMITLYAIRVILGESRLLIIQSRRNG